MVVVGGGGGGGLIFCVCKSLFVSVFISRLFFFCFVFSVVVRHCKPDFFACVTWLLVCLLRHDSSCSSGR